MSLAMQPLPPCEINILVRITVGIVSATFGTMSCFALINIPPVKTTLGVVSLEVWDFNVVRKWGGAGGGGDGQWA